MLYKRVINKSLVLGMITTVLVGSLVVTGQAKTEDQESIAALRNIGKAFASIAEQASPAVVAIQAEKVITSRTRGQRPELRKEAAGSGIPQVVQQELNDQSKRLPRVFVMLFKHPPVFFVIPGKSVLKRSQEKVSLCRVIVLKCLEVHIRPVCDSAHREAVIPLCGKDIMRRFKNPDSPFPELVRRNVRGIGL